MTTAPEAKTKSQATNKKRKVTDVILRTEENESTRSTDALETKLAKIFHARVAMREKKRRRTIDNVYQYEETINENRIVYCPCGVAMMKSTGDWLKIESPLHLRYGEYVFDPACSDLCRRHFRFYCTDCDAILARVYGAGHNGDLYCSDLCHRTKP